VIFFDKNDSSQKPDILRATISAVLMILQIVLTFVGSFYLKFCFVVLNL